MFVDDANALDVQRTEITGNTAGFDGGGLMLYDLYGSATIADGKISNNTAQDGGGGGLELYDVKLTNVPGGSVRIERMEIADNKANYDRLGGGVLLYETENAGVVIEDSTISGNLAGVGGGVVSALTVGSPAPLLSRSTVSGNGALQAGGGVAVLGLDPITPAALAVIDSTISGNGATYVGGGILVGTGGYLEVEHSTVTGNEVGYAGGGLFVAYDAPAPKVGHTILALNNAPASGADEYSGAGEYGIPTPVDLSWSILGDSLGATVNSIVGNQIDVDPLLDALQANGGPTETHKPLPGSPAIGSGDPAVTGEPPTDQRLYARKVGVIDVGAVELNPGTFELLIDPTSVIEGGGPVAVTVTRVGGQDGAVSVELNFSNGAATNPADWTAPNAVVNFADNDAAPKVFNVAIVDDAAPEPDETFSAALANPTGGALLGVTTSGTVTIHDNDSLPVVEVPALDDAGKALLIGLVAAAAVVFLRRRKGMGTALIFTVALTAGAAEAGSGKPRHAAAARPPGSLAAQPLQGASAARSWRAHGGARHTEVVRVASIDAGNVTLLRADGSLLTVKLSLVKQGERGVHQGSLLKVNAKARLKLRVGEHGEILKAKLKPARR